MIQSAPQSSIYHQEYSFPITGPAWSVCTLLHGFPGQLHGCIGTFGGIFLTNIVVSNLFFQLSVQTRPPNITASKDLHLVHFTTLAKVLKLVLQGWPNTIDDPLLQPYFERWGELSIEDGCVLWGVRVVIPPQLRAQVVDEVHEGHALSMLYVSCINQGIIQSLNN